MELSSGGESAARSARLSSDDAAVLAARTTRLLSPPPPLCSMGPSSGGGGDGDDEVATELSSDASAGAGGEDRLSALPDDVLVLILLKLSTSVAAQTRVLSHRWRRIWALLPELHFFFPPPEPHWLRDALDAHEVLLGTLFVGADGATPESLDVWLPAAARRVSGELILQLYGPANDAEEEDGDGAFEFPCFEMATSISLLLDFQGLALPPTGVFARLTELHLRCVWFRGTCKLGDAVSSPRCPCLQRLTVERARGLGELSIHSDSLVMVELERLQALSELTIVAPALKELIVRYCFRTSLHVVNISAPQLACLDWCSRYDPSSIHLGKMEHLWSLGTDFYLVYAPETVLHNQSCLSLLKRFKGIETLYLILICPKDIQNFQYMMEDMAVLPETTCLYLTVQANGHAFEASTIHVLRLCTGIRRLILHLAATGSEDQTVCLSDCICVQQVEWETEELLLNHLEGLEIIELRGTGHEVAFVKRLFDWGTKLKELTISFHRSISEVKAKELCQMFQSFSRPGVRTKFYLYQKQRKVLYAPE